MARWAPSTTLKFIREYKNQECLWNTQLDTYRDKQTRMTAYLKIVDAMDIPKFGVIDVKNKIKNLRSTYNQEKKKKATSLNSGSGEASSVYESNLNWLKEMEPTMINSTSRKRKTFDYVDDEDWQAGTFSETATSDQASSRAASPVSILVTPAHESIAQTICESIAQTIPESIPESIPQTISFQTNPSAISQTSPHKRKIRSLLNAVKELQAAVNADDEEKDCFDVFGQSVAAQLRKFSEKRAYLAQKDIQNIISEHGVQDIMERNSSAS